MSNLYYNALGNTYDTLTNINTGPFNSLTLHPYWTGNLWAQSTEHAIFFDFSNGDSDTLYASSGLYGMAVHPGNIIGVENYELETVATPEPATIALLGIGLVGLAGAEARRRRKKNAVDKS